jgi:hypothetical protein
MHRVTVYGPLLVCKHSVLWRQGTTAHVYPASNCRIDLTMPGHDGLFARQLPIALSCFSHLDTLGFFRRRFDLFCHRSACLAIVVAVLLFTTQLIGLLVESCFSW